VVEWPAEGVPLTSVEIDGAALTAAAAGAEVLWPDDDGPGGSSGGSIITAIG
jgi:hypothetical protein